MTTAIERKLAETGEWQSSFPAVIDSTILAAYSDCPLKSYREFFLKLGNPHPSIHLHAGGAFAKGIETVRRARWERELSLDECMSQGFAAFAQFWGEFEPPSFGSGANKTFERMWQAIEFYFEEYPLDNDSVRPYRFPDGKTGVEFTFGIPLPILHPDTGDPVVYAGRFDLLGYYEDLYAVVDEKTTTASRRVVGGSVDHARADVWICLGREAIRYRRQDEYHPRRCDTENQIHDDAGDQISLQRRAVGPMVSADVEQGDAIDLVVQSA